MIVVETLPFDLDPLCAPHEVRIVLKSTPDLCVEALRAVVDMPLCLIEALRIPLQLANDGTPRQVLGRSLACVLPPLSVDARDDARCCVVDRQRGSRPGSAVKALTAAAPQHG